MFELIPECPSDWIDLDLFSGALLMLQRYKSMSDQLQPNMNKVSSDCVVISQIKLTY